MLGFLKAGRGTPRRTYAIGDVHGRLDLFQRLLAVIRRDNATRVPGPVRIVMLGDLVDHGPDACSLVRYCRLLDERLEQFVVLKGDHEAMMVDALRGGGIAAVERWLDHGGGATLRSWGVDDRLLSGHDQAGMLTAARERVNEDTLSWMDALPLTVRHERFLFVHAGIRPGTPLKMQSARDLIAIRSEFLQSKEDHGFVVVHGHSVRESGPDIHPNRIGIDTGAYRTGRLTAIGVEDGQFWPLMTSPSQARGGADDRADEPFAGLKP